MWRCISHRAFTYDRTKRTFVHVCMSERTFVHPNKQTLTWIAPAKIMAPTFVTLENAAVTLRNLDLRYSRRSQLEPKNFVEDKVRISISKNVVWQRLVVRMDSGAVQKCSSLDGVATDSILSEIFVGWRLWSVFLQARTEQSAKKSWRRDRENFKSLR